MSKDIKHGIKVFDWNYELIRYIEIENGKCIPVLMDYICDAVYEGGRWHDAA